MLHVENISKSYIDAGQQRLILEQLSFSVQAGESLSIQGNSGSGKSSLLHMIAALDKPDKGDIFFQHQQHKINLVNFSEKEADQFRKKDIGIVFQKYNLIDCIKVVENIELPAKLCASNKTIDHEYINSLMTTLDILQHKNKLPHQLSGGEQQRVAIARALSHKPPLLLADEPTGNLDSENARTVSQLLIDTCLLHNTSLVLVTHSHELASMTDKQARIKHGHLETYA